MMLPVRRSKGGGEASGNIIQHHTSGEGDAQLTTTTINIILLFFFFFFFSLLCSLFLHQFINCQIASEVNEVHPNLYFWIIESNSWDVDIPLGYYCRLVAMLPGIRTTSQNDGRNTLLETPREMLPIPERTCKHPLGANRDYSIHIIWKSTYHKSNLLYFNITGKDTLL